MLSYRVRHTIANVIGTLAVGVQDLSQKYFPQAGQYLPREDEEYFQHPKDFDYNSIMIYDSSFGMLEGIQRFLLMTYDEEVIYMGGHSSPDKAGLSNFDIERVAALYPEQHAGQGAMQARNLNDIQKKQPTLEVVIPNLITTTVSPVPTDFSKSVNDPKAMEIARQYAAVCGRRCSGTFLNWRFDGWAFQLHLACLRLKFMI